MTGADIAAVVSEALTRLEDYSFAEDISVDDWKAVGKEVADEVITGASGQDSLNKIAANYIRPMRYAFLLVSNDLLFDPRYYTVSSDEGQEGEISAGYDGPVPGSDAPYDQALFQTLDILINRHAAKYERLLISKASS